MTAVPRAARFWQLIDAMAAHGESLVRAFHRVLGASGPLGESLAFLVATLRRRMDAVVPRGERLVPEFRRLLGNASLRKAIMLVAAGVAALGLIFVFLEISVRSELARDATGVASAGPDQIQSGNLLPGTPASTADVEFVGALGAAKPFSGEAQTLAPVSRTPIPLPRPRPKR
jgi:hypothetical protein